MVSKQREKDPEAYYLRGYCRVCNRHFYYRNQLDTECTQVHQHHSGVCQIWRHSCARIKEKAKKGNP